MVIFDRMNTIKTLIDRSALTSKHYQADDQPSQMIALMTLAGVNSIVTNNWSTTPEDNLKQYDLLMRTVLSEGIYLGTTALKRHFKNHEPDALLIHKANIATFGVPLMRIV